MDQGTKILQVHQQVLAQNLQQAQTNPQVVFHVIRDQGTQKIVATGALLNNQLNGAHSRPPQVAELSYFYQTDSLQDDLANWILEDLSQQAKQAGFQSIYTTSRKKGMDHRNTLLKQAGFQEVTDPKRLALLAPPLLQTPRTIVYEKLL